MAREIAEPTRHPRRGTIRMAHCRAVTAMQGPLRFSMADCDGRGRPHGDVFSKSSAITSAKARAHRAVAGCARFESAQRRISLVALKGAALHKMAIYAPASGHGRHRLLAQECDANAVSKLIEDCGFESTLVTRRDLTFEPRRAMIRRAPGLVGRRTRRARHARRARRLASMPTVRSRSNFIPASVNRCRSARSISHGMFLHGRRARESTVIRRMPL